MKDKKIKLNPALEILGAIGTEKLSTQQVTDFKDDAKRFLHAEANINLNDDFDVNIVDNSANEVNLILPFYDALHFEAAQMTDAELQDVSGGEVAIGVIAVGGTIATILATIIGIAVDKQVNQPGGK